MPAFVAISLKYARFRAVLHWRQHVATGCAPCPLPAMARSRALVSASPASPSNAVPLPSMFSRGFASTNFVSNGSGSNGGSGSFHDRKKAVGAAATPTNSAVPTSAPSFKRRRSSSGSADSPKDDRGAAGGHGRCIAYCTAEGYHLDGLQALLLQRDRVARRYGHDVLHVEVAPAIPSFDADAFFFKDGVAVFWNARDADIAIFRQDVKLFERNASPVVEFEEMPFKFGPSARVKGGVLLLTADADPREIAREKMAFSYGLQRSVRLAVIEEAVDDAIGGMRDIPSALLSHGRLKMKKADVMRSLGKLLGLRGTINMHSDLLETPDVYWEYPRLEELYTMVSRDMDLVARIACTNRKLDYGKELIETLRLPLFCGAALFLTSCRTDIAEKHSSNAEVAIIVLISVEVLLAALIAQLQHVFIHSPFDIFQVCFAVLHLYSDYQKSSASSTQKTSEHSSASKSEASQTGN